jgi:hypothetical protein
MHPVGNSWIGDHEDVAESNGVATCSVCHGTNYRGTVLSRSSANRAVSSQFGSRTYWRGYEVGCYDCHNGPTSDNQNPNQPPVVQNRAEATPTDQPLALVLTANDPNNNALTLRIVDQPRHGAVAFDGTNAVYRAWDGYVGADSFTYAASDSQRNSNLGIVSITVQAPACAGSWSTFGYGCDAATGDAPSLRLSGCPVGGQPVDVRLEDGPATGFAVVALGYGRGTAELSPGCVLRVDTVLAITPLLALVSGSASFSLAVPTGMGPFDCAMQGFSLHPGAARGYVATPGLEVRFR